MARTFRFKLMLKDQNDPKDKHAFNEFNWLDLVADEEKSRIEAKMGEIVRTFNGYFWLYFSQGKKYLFNLIYYIVFEK